MGVYRFRSIQDATIQPSVRLILVTVRVCHSIGPLRLILLFCLLATAGCAAAQRPTAGRHLELQTITHDWQTTYVYRSVPD